MLPIIYFFFIVAWVIFILGFFVKEYAIVGLGSFCMMILGVYSIINGLEGLDNLGTLTMAVINICIGGYALIRGAYENTKDL